MYRILSTGREGQLREMNATAPQYLAKGQQRTPELDEKVRHDALNGLILRMLGVQEAKIAA